MAEKNLTIIQEWINFENSMPKPGNLGPKSREAQPAPAIARAWFGLFPHAKAWHPLAYFPNHHNGIFNLILCLVKLYGLGIHIYLLLKITPPQIQPCFEPWLSTQGVSLNPFLKRLNSIFQFPSTCIIRIFGSFSPLTRSLLKPF